MNEPLVTVRNASLAFHGREILNGVDLDVLRGEIVTLIGPNGAGKSCLIKGLLGLLAFDQGQVTRQPGIKIGYMPQRLHLDDSLPMTVARFLSINRSIKKKQITGALNEVGITALYNTPVQALSGGEMQRLLLARVLLRDPDLLVLDEPAQGVDIIGQQELYQLIVAIRDRYHCGVLMVSHDLHLVMEATDRVLCLNRHICCTGHPDAISQHPEYLRLFGDAMEGFAVYTHHHDHEHDSQGNVVPLGTGCQHWDDDKGCQQPKRRTHTHG